jgi:UDP-N-acetylmuramoylalanine--D-glutamate ligase
VEYVHSSEPRPPIPEGPFLVVGLARSGVSAAKVLSELGESVRGVDSGYPDGLTDLDTAGIPYEAGTDGIASLEGVATVVKSPGVPREARVVREALGRGIRVIGELELGWRLVAARFVGITGTNGKTTTTELVAHILRSAGRPAEAVGNVGSPITALAGRALPDDLTVVCECSSFQLEDTEHFAPECAVHLNLSPDHLDRHRSMEAYAEAKLRIFANQGPGDVAVLNEGDPHLAGMKPPGDAAVVRFVPAGRGASDVDIWLDGDQLVVDGAPLLGAGEMKVAGRHNVANAMAAAAAALSLGLPPDLVAKGLRTFAGVPHRMETVAEAGGLRFINDSKATNVAAASSALESFDSEVRLILGGSLKGEDFSGLLEPVSKACSGVYLIGDAAGSLAEVLGSLRGRIPVRTCGDLESALDAAREDGRPGETVLLSPACASFDQFRDFEDRGDTFRRLVGDRLG